MVMTKVTSLLECAVLCTCIWSITALSTLQSFMLRRAVLSGGVCTHTAKSRGCRYRYGSALLDQPVEYEKNAEILPHAKKPI
ncbi:hypothetical protein B0T09DRAFT_338208 [Sordaria sp. MPI-SDFR-AT-0083]|nr:hypothetical protein B0T09DRAFT_338208 [Sordaria sp. MPI-SDFR-AT-0083]